MKTRARNGNNRLQSIEQLVYTYFQYITQKNLDGLLDLFANDAVVYEPFSKVVDGLRGKSMIGEFLKVVLMANTGLERIIEFEKPKGPASNMVTALVTFSKGDSVRARFTFESEGDDDKKIKSLTIKFVN